MDTLRKRESREAPGFDPVREFHRVEDVFLSDPICSDVTLPDPLAEAFPINIEECRHLSGAEEGLPFTKPRNERVGIW